MLTYHEEFLLPIGQRNRRAARRPGAQIKIFVVRWNRQPLEQLCVEQIPPCPQNIALQVNEIIEDTFIHLIIHDLLLVESGCIVHHAG